MKTVLEDFGFKKKTHGVNVVVVEKKKRKTTCKKSFWSLYLCVYYSSIHCFSRVVFFFLPGFYFIYFMLFDVKCEVFVDIFSILITTLTILSFIVL